MKPGEFKRFQDELPEKGLWIIVSNNINATLNNGEMSHVWLVNFWSMDSRPIDGIVSFDAADRKITNLTHWRYV